ncbi:MAG: ISKra4 family transposase [Actinomycetota bacterium]
MGRGISPLDRELGLSASAFSPYLVEAVTRLGTAMPFERVPEALSFFTQVGIGEETARAVTERAGAILQELEEAEVAEIERGERSEEAGLPVQQVSVDGAMVHLVKEGWAEVKTLAIGKVEVTLGGEVHAKEVSYFSRLDTADEFRRLAVGELCRRGTVSAKTVCAVVDGAEWLQKFVDWHVPQAVRILDFPHAAEHVSLAAQAAFGPGTAEVSEWLDRWLHELKHGDPDQVLAAVRALPTENSTDPVGAAKTRDQIVAYLAKRRAQIAYAEFLAAGYPIGSGMVESANKLVVEARLKGSGMHWARPNVNPMLALRTAACSGRWKQEWPRIWQGLCAPRRKRRRADAEPAPTDPISTPDPPRPPLRPKHPGAIKLEKRGLIQNGRPSDQHPWKAGLRYRDRSMSAPS